ncbi:MAG: bifunctional diaminohydroxyphosphoribosylaminopyrimidine deaminase/5-amino-6-(5-phosphoribosylamino)uracil reductase RibD [Pseudoflavonifractor sp.]|nr:bifunctional diaminohydroxyphosphoribosylaminopyrimidine deaminase/5-amino-6-(5-phosphoribosylamino)uracil reductase RibD [Pseudoflavonifractor sp.]MDY3019367.1 bifunctional diaminohydroxyphosphoribosylaminopyrimidine deaminase/5-amino-6-(5-phosphoribosylamino)uracil reductase RibD [Oscillospiraceae bacterium]
MEEQEYMRRCVALAKQGIGWTSPNPMVGAVIVKNGRIIGEGWHVRRGELHAERHALSRCTESPDGADLYVTLEPCCHHGRQPPCTDAILAAGIRRVHVGSDDPNPLAAGKGLEILRSKGVEVKTGILKEECDGLNQVFFHFIRTGTPYVVMKYAMTLDGKIAAYTGKSQWITGKDARSRVHQERHRLRGILVGVGTVLADDPMLNCRMEGGRDPVRIVCDTHLRTPADSRLVKSAGRIETILATCCTDPARQRPYLEAGCRVWQLPAVQGRVNLSALMQRLGQAEIDSVLLEGGAELNWSMLEAGLVQKVQVYLAPKLLGGLTARSPIGGQGVPEPGRGWRLENSVIHPIGEDFLIESEVAYCVHGAC